MYAPGVLWTAAHHKIPMLSVMHNNRGYHQEVMHRAAHVEPPQPRRRLGRDMQPIGTGIMNPDIDYAKLAESMGVWSAGPIKDPNDLAPTLKRAVEVVKAGEPALVDVRHAAALRKLNMKIVNLRTGLAAVAALILGHGAAVAASAERGQELFHQEWLLAMPRPASGRAA